MSTVALTARFPLGVYHGHGADGSPDQWPSPARLFSALVAAAWTGADAPGDGTLNEGARRLLSWLEENPPTGLRLPPSMPVVMGTRQRIAYRDAGTLDKSRPKKAPKAISDGVAVGGEIAWIWESMPQEVQDALARLCADVPHLGEADSLVVLEVVPEVEATWRLDARATAFTSGGLRLPVPAPGRAQALAVFYAQTRPARMPTTSKDRYRANEELIVFPTPMDCLRSALYSPVGAEDGPGGEGSPWGDALIFLADDGTGRELAPSRRVDWCVAFHRALVARIGDGAPAVVTGRYPQGRSVPANRLAIQYAPSSVLARSVVPGADGAPGAFLIMLPAGLGADETAVILAALEGMSQVRSRWGVARLRRPDEIIRADDFWQSPPSGTTRLWSPTPAAVPEVVRQRGEWSFDSAILLSLGFVWRDVLEPVERGTKGYRDLVAQVRGRGASVMWYRRLTSDPAGYAHRMPLGMVAQPYRALLDAGDLLPERSLVAVGQSRHLGGGLLVPADLPSELVSRTRRPHAEH